MPQIEVRIFADKDGKSPFLDFLDSVPPKVQDKCIARIDLIKQYGHELRRPIADFLRNGIFELRIRHKNINYRILYFFYMIMAVISHGLTKKGGVPEKEIDKAVGHRKLFSSNPEAYTYKKGADDG
ncbi:MAG: type II toxin-antitoxin system RelE/ParE family toxin [Planctomycetota bacterium]|nr:MAG: type II toxin-antitoxin system RelE/ParE family toxin [Planctomycetota bacterium]